MKRSVFGTVLALSLATIVLASCVAPALQALGGEIYASAANAVREFSFVWVVPDVVGTYVIEVGFVPVQLTAADVAWLKVT
jgi:hypothetical protein